MISKFDDIRPYDEKEFLAAMERVAEGHGYHDRRV